MLFYTLHNPDTPWGDYGRILYTGMATYNKSGELVLERTGPFVPPISIPGLDGIVVTDQFRQTLEKSGLTGFTFYPAIKKRIVRLDWEKWDKNTDEPKHYPPEGEPENYLLKQRHNKMLSEQMGLLWDLRLFIGADVARIQIGKQSFEVELQLRAATWNGADLFRARNSGYRYASARAREWFERNAADLLIFRPCPTL